MRSARPPDRHGPAVGEMPDLGDTANPRALIPGDPDAIADNVRAIGGRGHALAQVGAALDGIDTGDGGGLR